MNINSEYNDHWLYLFLSQYKTLFNQKAINAFEQFAFNVSVLEEPLTMVPISDLPKQLPHFKSSDPNFHIVVDKNFFVYILQRTWHPDFGHTYHFQTCGPAYDYINGTHFEISADHILFVSQEQVNVDFDQMFGRYENQLLHVYQTLPKTIYPEEYNPVTDMIARSFKELQGPWATLHNPLTHITP